RLLGDVVRETGRVRPGADGVLEDVDLLEAALLDERAGGEVLLVRLSRESDDQVARELDARAELAGLGAERQVLLPRVAAVHAAEHGVAARLRGKVQV